MLYINYLISLDLEIIVYLIYRRYEELLANHNGLLRLLSMHNSETKNLKEINECLHEEIESLKGKVESLEDRISTMKTKIKDLRLRKNSKVPIFNRKTQ